MLEAALNQKIRVKEGERETIMSRLAIGFEQLAIQFAKGDRYARRDVFELADRFGIDLVESLSHVSGPVDQASVSANDEALLADYVRRQSAQVQRHDGSGDVRALPPPDRKRRTTPRLKGISHEATAAATPPDELVHGARAGPVNPALGAAQGRARRGCVPHRFRKLRAEMLPSAESRFPVPPELAYRSDSLPSRTRACPQLRAGRLSGSSSIFRREA